MHSCFLNQRTSHLLPVQFRRYCVLNSHLEDLKRISLQSHFCMNGHNERFPFHHLLLQELVMVPNVWIPLFPSKHYNHENQEKSLGVLKFWISDLVSSGLY